MGEFPSGQRGQTVNLLLIASVVRIHLPPPAKSTIQADGAFCWYRYSWMGIRTHLNTICRWHIARRRLDGGDTSIFAFGKNANRIHLPPPNKHRNFDTKITVLILVYLRKNQVFSIFLCENQSRCGVEPQRSFLFIGGLSPFSGYKTPPNNNLPVCLLNPIA